MKLSKAKAKKIGIEVWDYLAKHGEIEFKSSLPIELYSKIVHMAGPYPLCDHFKINTCKGCPLNNKNDNNCADYAKWVKAKTNKTRAKYAAIIRDKIKAW